MEWKDTKEKVAGAVVSKGGHADSVLEIKGLITIDFLEKRSNSKQCFSTVNS